MECHVFMPRDTPPVFRVECERYGAKVTLVDGLIDDCGRIVAERAPREGWHDVSTLKEPYRVEGKKTMGYELAEDFGWELPDAIVYPTGGGTGLIGMWKAFEEMEEIGWIGAKRPRMIAVQAEGCAPIPKAFAEGKRRLGEVSRTRATYASGLRVPKAFADYLILRDVRASGGAAVAVTDDEMRAAPATRSARPRASSSPRRAARAWAAAKKLAARGPARPREPGRPLQHRDAGSSTRRQPTPPKWGGPGTAAWCLIRLPNLGGEMKRYFRPAAAALALLGASLLLPHELRAATCTWDSTANDWNTSASHWSCGVIPGAGDSIVVSGGTLTISTSHSVTGVTHSAGTIDGAGNLNVSGAFSWTGGTTSGSGTTTIAATSTLTINSGAVGIQRTITNNGTITWVAGQLQMSNGTINNNATFTAQPNNNISNFGGTNAFNNNAAGTFTRNTGTGQLDMNIPLTNAGALTVSTGEMRINGGGSSTGTIDATSTILTFTNSYSVTAGTFTVGTLNLQGGTIDMTPTTYTVPTVNLTGSTYNLNKTSNASNWNHSGGTLAGSGAVTVSSGKTYAWTGGTMSGGATTTVASGGDADDQLGRGRDPADRSPTTGRSRGWPASSRWSNGTINNNATFTAQPNNNISNFGGTNAFNNNAAGTFTRNTGTGQLDMNIPLTNAGTLTVSTGEMRINGGGSSTGTIDATSTILTITNNYSITAGTFTVGTLNLQGGTIDMTPTTYTVPTVNLTGSTYNLNKTSNASNWNHSGGTLAGSGAVTVSSGKTYAWTGGTMAGRRDDDGRLRRDADDQLGRGRDPADDHQQRDDHVGGRPAPDVQRDASTTTRRSPRSRTTTSATSAAPTPSTTTRPEPSPATPGPGSWTSNIPFTNAGTLTVSTGEMRINGGGSSTGTIDATSTILTFTNSYSVTAGTFTVGTLNLQGGTIDMTPTTYTVPTVNLTGSTYNLNKTSNASNWNHSAGPWPARAP